MRRDHPESLLLIGFFLVLLGMVLPVLMVLQIIETTFFLSFVSWGSTVGCLFLGWIGATHYVRVRKK